MKYSFEMCEKIDDLAEKIAKLFKRYHYSRDPFFEVFCGISEMIKEHDTDDIIMELDMISNQVLDSSQADVKKAEKLTAELYKLIEEI